MPSIKPADEFSDGWGNYIVLPYEAVDWSGVAHGDSNKPCVGAATGGPVQTAHRASWPDGGEVAVEYPCVWED